MKDWAMDWTDKRLKELEEKIREEFTIAEKEITAKMQAYLDRFAKQDAVMLAKYKNGEITKEKLTEWRTNHFMMGKNWQAVKNSIAQDIVNTDLISAKIVNNALIDVYTQNANYAYYQLEQNMGTGLSFDLYDRNAVENLLKDNPDFMPHYEPKTPIVQRWNKQHITSEMLQGILQGESIPHIAKRMQNVVGMERNSAIRNARTYTTSVENKAKMDRYEEAEEAGVELEKEWMATLDERTRESHRELDGERVANDEPFSNGLMYPGDANGEPSEVYNCFIPSTKIGVDSRIIRSYKHRYEGEVISIKSALGVEFTVTPNHPILTDRGWIAAKLLNEGDNLIVTSGIGNEVSRRNPNINHAFPRIDTIHQLLDIFGGKRTSDLRVNFHGDIPTSEVEIITQKGFLWSDLYTSVRKCVNKFLLKYTDTSLMRKCSFVKHFGRIMRTTFDNVGGVCKSFSFFLRSMSHSDIHGLRAVTDGNVVFGKDTLNDLPTNVVLPSEIKNGLARKVFLDNIVSVERSDFVGHVYNLQTDNNYYFVNSSITNNNAHCNDIMAIAHNCRCRIVSRIKGRQYDRSGRASKLGDMSYEEWKNGKNRSNK